MGETLVYPSASISSSKPQDSLLDGAYNQSSASAALAATTMSALAQSTMSTQAAQRSPVRERKTLDYNTRVPTDGSQYSSNTSQRPAIILRRLPLGIGQDGVRNMLLFAKELAAVQLVESNKEDAGFATAIASFNTLTAAYNVQESLDGKMNASHDAKMIVEMVANSSPIDASANARLASRRGTLDGDARGTGQSNTGSSSDQPNRQSRFSSTFQPSEKISPPLTGHSQSPSDFPIPDSSARFQTLFSPRSPVISRDRQNNFGKSVINDDAVDDETDGLLRDPLGYARNGASAHPHRPSMPQLPTSQFSNLSLGQASFDGPSPLSGSNSGLASPVGGPLQHGGSSYQSRTNSYGSGTPMSGPPRTSYPPANPADQNPPCNTLYVGNLPNNTSEDELKRMFSQQRGYKRLCFRTKQNGPMCFVEFESVTLATQALHHLYGKMLSNSVKGGIRLSFSKNPLGVRAGQPGFSPSGMNVQGGYSNFNDVNPPPGFAPPSNLPPGLVGGGRSSHGYGPPSTQGQMSPVYQAHQYSMSGAPFASQLRMPPAAMYQNNSPSPGSHNYNQNFFDSAAR